MSGINIFGHQALFEHVYKSAPIGIALVTIEGNWISVNPAACKMFGLTEEELMAQPATDYIYSDCINNKDKLFQSLDETSSTIAVENNSYIETAVASGHRCMFLWFVTKRINLLCFHFANC